MLKKGSIIIQAKYHVVVVFCPDIRISTFMVGKSTSVKNINGEGFCLWGETFKTSS